MRTTQSQKPPFGTGQKTATPSAAQHRVSLRSAMPAMGQAGHCQQPPSTGPPCPHCCPEGADEMEGTLQLPKIS